MQIFLDENETWQVNLDETEKQDNNRFNDWYMEAIPRYLNSLDLAFRKAKEINEFQFILCLLRVRGIEEAGWDPFETTLRVIPDMLKVHSQISSNFEAARHIELWIYGHILEASEPYELLANLIDVVNGGTSNATSAKNSVCLQIRFEWMRILHRKTKRRDFEVF